MTLSVWRLYKNGKQSEKGKTFLFFKRFPWQIGIPITFEVNVYEVNDFKTNFTRSRDNSKTKSQKKISKKIL